jgi:hypothetical protein
MSDKMYWLGCPRCGERETLSVFRVQALKIMSMKVVNGKLDVCLNENMYPVHLADSDYMYPGGEKCDFRIESDISISPNSNIPYAAVHCESCSLFGQVNLWEVYHYNRGRGKIVTLFNLEEEKMEKFTIPEILEEINRDRSDQWSPYTVEDWQEGWEEWCEGKTYKLLMVKRGGEK